MKVAAAPVRVYPFGVTLRTGFFLLVSVASAAPLLAQPATSNPFAGDAEQIDIGRTLFRTYCSPCHGIAAQGGRGPDLSRGVYHVGDEDSDLFLVISEGSPGTEMPAYGERIPDETIWRLVAFIRSVAKAGAAPARGDPERGGELYRAQGCAGCHQIRSAGGRLGPDLTRVGRTRSAVYLRQALVAPDDDVPPASRTVEVVAGDGKTYRGVGLNFDNFYVALMDPTETVRTFERSELTSAQRLTGSLMPSYASLSADELDDLVAYLSQLRGQETPR